MKNINTSVFIASIIMSTFVYSFFFTNQKLIERFDFTAFIKGASLVSSGGGEDLYRIPKVNLSGNTLNYDAPLVYKNTPPLILLFLPLIFFPLSVSYKIFVVIELLLLVAAAKLLAEEFPEANKNNIFLYTVSFVPGILSVITGQISFLLLINFVYIYKYLKEKNGFLLGIFSGLLFIKPQYLLFVPFIFLFIKDKRKFLLSFTFTVLSGILLSVFIVGTTGLSRYLPFIYGTESRAFTSDVYSQISFTSLLFNLSRIFTPLAGKEYLLDLALYLTVLFYIIFSYRRRNGKYYFYSAVLFTLAFLPHLWDYDLVLILPVFLAMRGIRENGKNALLTGLMSYLLYFGWIARFLGFPYLISISLVIPAIFLLKPPKTWTIYKVAKL